jgi:hypothetical protein
MNQIIDINDAYKFVLNNLIKKGFVLDKVIPINHNRYIIAKGSPGNILIMFKREVFYNFGQMFRHKGYSGVGDSINCKDLIEANKHNVSDIYITFPNGNIYTITLEDFLNNSIKWTNKENKEVRSISIHKYKRVII